MALLRMGSWEVIGLRIGKEVCQGRRPIFLDGRRSRDCFNRFKS